MLVTSFYIIIYNYKTIVTLNKFLYCSDYTIILKTYDLSISSESLVLNFLTWSLISDNLLKLPLCLTYDLAHILYSTNPPPYLFYPPTTLLALAFLTPGGKKGG